jgi:hypothetical protein
MGLIERKFSYLSLQTIFLICSGLLFLYIGIPSLYKRISWCDGYALGDWLINYEDGGFKRRGFSGSMFIFLSKVTGIYIGKLVFVFISVLYILFITQCILFLRKIKIDFSLILILFIPTTLFFPINDLYAFGRKEILLFNIFLFFLISRDRYNIYSWKYILVLSLLILVCTLFHELIVFYVPYIMLIYWIDYYKNVQETLFKIGVIGLSSFIPAFIIFLFGKDVNEGESWEIFKQLGVSSNIMNGIFSWPKEGFGKGQVNALMFAKSRHYYLYLGSYFITIISFCFLFIKNSWLGFSRNKVILTHLLLLFLSIPIFFLTIDWGRWLNIHFVCSLFFILAFYSKNEIKKLFTLQTILSNLKIDVIFKFIILIFIVFGFSMFHVDLGFKLGQNGLLTSIRDLFWHIRHVRF